MTKLQRLYVEYGQSPWLDNLTRGYLRDGTLARMVADGIRGVTANPTIFAKAIEGSADYDEQFSSLTAAGWSVEDAYWELVVADITAALAVLRPVFDAADGTDGFVSVEVAPELARDTKATIDAARGLHHRVDQPNLFVKIPATAQGAPAVEAMIAEGRSINITLIFSLTRYAEVIEVYLSGLEAFTAGGGDPARVHSVASFFVSRVDTEVDQRLEAIGTDEALELRGLAAVATTGQARRTPAAAAVGLDVHQEPHLSRHPVRRPAHRPQHRQHPARAHDRRLRGPRHPGPHHRLRRPGGRRGDAPTGRRRYRHGRRRPDPGGQGCRRLPRVFPRHARQARRQGRLADSTLRWPGVDGRCSG